MSPDPYSGSYDFTTPQSFNRYNYVLNDPLGTNDPNGMVGDSGGGAGATFPCYAAGAEAGMNPGADIFCGISVLFAWHSWSSLFGHPTFHGSLKPRPSTGDPAWITNSGETLGLPAGTPLNNIFRTVISSFAMPR